MLLGDMTQALLQIAELSILTKYLQTALKQEVLSTQQDESLDHLSTWMLFIVPIHLDT